MASVCGLAFPVLFAFAFSVASSERLLQQQRSLLWKFCVLRSLREIKDNGVFVLHAECAKSAEIYYPLYSALALEWS